MAIVGSYDKSQWRSSVTNGRIPRDKLAVVECWPTYDRDLDGPALMHPEAAAAMGVMLRTAADQGFGDLTISLSYRTYEVQWEKWENYQAGGNLAAYPGTSNHGWAVAGDMRWGRAVTLDWLQRNAPRFGFINDVPSENWHYTFQEGGWDGDDMTEEEKRKLEASFAALQGIRDFNRDDDPPADAHPARIDAHRALSKASRLPKPGTPGPHDHPEYDPSRHKHPTGIGVPTE